MFIFSRYFEDEEEDSSNVELPYIPAENSPTRQQFHSKSADSDSDDDPLEAFMAEVEARASSGMFVQCCACASAHSGLWQLQSTCLLTLGFVVLVRAQKWVS